MQASADIQLPYESLQGKISRIKCKRHHLLQKPKETINSAGDLADFSRNAELYSIPDQNY